MLISIREILGESQSAGGCLARDLRAADVMIDSIHKYRVWCGFWWLVDLANFCEWTKMDENLFKKKLILMHLFVGWMFFFE